MTNKQTTSTMQHLRQRNHLVIKREDFLKVALLAIACIFLIALANFLRIGFFDNSFNAYTFLFVLVGQTALIIGLFLYFLNSRKEIVYTFKKLVAICVCLVISYVVNLFLSIISQYMMPIAMVAFLVAPIADRLDSYIVNIICIAMLLFNNIFLSINGQNAIDSVMTLFAMALAGILCGSLVSYRIYTNTKRLSYILRGIFYSAIAFMLVLLIEVLYAGSIGYFDYIWSESWYYLIVSFSLCIVVGLMLQPIFEIAFNIITNTRLIELTDHNNILIKRLMDEAPGTFNHSLFVANFAEICARAIGENPYMARASAYYHDVGKLINPVFFKENQGEINPHDDILPELSAEIISKHANDGREMCLMHNVPEEIANMTVEHHGTLPIAVFYHKAKQLIDTEVDMEQYRYKGQTPRTKIAAILMICDASEAAIRAMGNPDGEKVDKLLRNIINQRIELGQFVNCSITLRDLDIIRQTIINMYGGVFHQRVQYPDGGKTK